MATGGGKSGLLASSAHSPLNSQTPVRAPTRNFNTKHTLWFITALFDIFHLFSIYDSIDHVISISHDKPSQSPSTRQIQPPITTAPSNSSEENVILRTLTIRYISTTIYPPLHF